MVEQRFFKPEYADHVLEVVKALVMRVWWENTRRWIRIEVLKDLVGNYAPYSVRVYLRGPSQTDPWAEIADYPFSTANSPETAVTACFDDLDERAEIVEGIKFRDSLPENPPIPRPD